MKRLLSMLLALVLAITCCPFFSSAASEEAEDAALALSKLGLFSGTGTNPDGTPNFDLDRVPTRVECITMLVKLLGKEAEAMSTTWKTPFTDVPTWAEHYVGYAYSSHLSSGTSATTFGSYDLITAPQYISFVLQTLGYVIGMDFQWDKAWELSDRIGLTSGEYNVSTSNFTRGDVAIISYRSLALKGVLPDRSPVTITKELMYSGNDVVVKAADVEKDSDKSEIGFYLENNSNLNLNFSVMACAINGVMCTNNLHSAYTNVPAGKRAKAKLEITDKWYEVYDSNNIEYVDALFWAYDDAIAYKAFDTDTVRTETTAYSGRHEFSYKDGRKPAYSENGILVYADKITTESVIVAIYNTGDTYINFNMDNVSINDWAFDIWIQVYDEYVLPGCVGFFEFKIDSKFLEDTDITSINSVELALTVYPADDYTRKYTTGPIKIM